MTDKSNYRAADDAYEATNDDLAPVSGDVKDNSYQSSDAYPVQVQKDNAPLEDPIAPPESNSDATLGRDEEEAIDKSNILKDRTRGANVKPGTYSEGPDEDDLPSSVKGGDNGRSAIRH